MVTKIKTPCIAVYAKKRDDQFGLSYGQEVDVVDRLSNGYYDVMRDGWCFYVDARDLYFPQLNTYNQKCFN